MEHLSDTDIERIAERLADKGSGGRIIRTSNGDGGFRKLVDSVLVIAIAALVGVVWNMSSNVAAMTAQIGYLSQEVQALRARAP